MVTALELATLLRVSEIVSVDRKSVCFSGTGVTFSLSKARKAQKSGALKSFSINRIDNPLICPVDCLGQYVYRTNFLRSDIIQSLLFVGLRKPHAEVSGYTVGRWVKNYLSYTGVDSTIFSAHSTRGSTRCGNVKTFTAGTSIDSILATANWARKSTFSKFHHREICPRDVASALFLMKKL